LFVVQIERFRRITMPRLRSLFAFFLLAALLVSPLPPVAQGAAREPARGKRAMVASQSKLASEIGADVMRRGGNAVDAAVAVALAMAVTYPEAGNIGGGGFMLMRFKDGRTTAIDYREKAPVAASRNVFVNDKGELVKGEGSSTVGYRAAGVPGTVAGLAMALEKYGSGKFKWAQLVEPARKLAVNGFPLSHRILNVIRAAEPELAPYKDSKRIFLNNGNYYQEGDILRQPELAATLGRMQKQGPREFYEGKTANLIAADMKRHNGLMTLEDLKAYRPTERTPLRGNYRGHEIISMPPPSSGGTALLQMLNILEGYDMRSMSWSSVERYHVIAEAMRRAFADRAAYMGDADFVKVPVGGMIDKDYAATLRATISLNKASRSADVRAGNPPGRESMDTTHFTVVDADGNCVSNTYTINDLYGSGVTAEGTGILLNDEMDDFAARPGKPNAFGLVQGENNAVQGGKRPLSSMTPTIVLRRDGSLWFAVGARGGPRIISASLQAVLNVIDHGMNIQQALDAPRIHHQWLPDEIMQEPYGLSLDTQRLLLERGHRFGEKPQYVAQTTGIMIEENTGIRLGAVDSRGDGEAVGY
jgi:gamma-glutamyltranspeptidase/glutathione hydrolase